MSLGPVPLCSRCGTSAGSKRWRVNPNAMTGSGGRIGENYLVCESCKEVGSADKEYMGEYEPRPPMPDSDDDALDPLSIFWDIQAEQQKLWHDIEALTQADRDSLVKDLLLGLHEETAELQRLADGDRYHILKKDDRKNAQAIAEAGVDVFKYLIATMLAHGVTSRQFASEFVHKTEIVSRKWRWERDRMEGLNVLLCDIDGCVADWVAGFRAWAYAKGVDVTPTNVNAVWMESDKDAFHSGGGFLAMPEIPGAVSVLNAWRGEVPDRRLVLVTARPVRRHPRVYADTLAWCARVGLRYDHILFERDKGIAVGKVAPAHISAFIEDRAKHAAEVAATRTTVIKLPHFDLEERIEHPLIRHVSDWEDIRKILL